MTRTMTEIKKANDAIGNHWFEASTMRFFGSRVGSTTYPAPAGGEYFVSSEQREWNTPRCYTIRHAKVNGSIDTVGDFMAYQTRSQAVAAVKRLQQS